MELGTAYPVARCILLAWSSRAARPQVFPDAEIALGRGRAPAGVAVVQWFQ